MSTHLKTLISKLNDTSRRAAERAASLCMARGHYEVDLEHFFLALLEQPQSDFVLLCRHFEIPTEALQRDLEAEIGRFKNGNTRTPVFSQQLPVLLEHAWLIASLDSHLSRVRSAHLLLALLTEPSLSQLAYRGSKLFAKFKLEDLKHRLPELTTRSQEAADSLRNADAPAPGDAPADEAGSAEPGAPGKTPALDQFTSNLTPARPRRQARSSDRPRGRDPPGHRHPDAPPPEQPHPDRRGRRGQDRGGRGPGLAHRGR